MHVLMQGHCLVVGFQFSWWNLISTMRSTLRKTLGKKEHHRSTKVQLKLSTNNYSMVEKVLSCILFFCAQGFNYHYVQSQLRIFTAFKYKWGLNA